MANILNNGMIISTDYQFAKVIDRSIETVIIPSSSKFIGNYAFAGCAQLTRVYVPKNVKSIGTFSFQNATLLEEITFEDYSITSIGTSAFQGCALLEELKLPIGLTLVNVQAFSNCTSLKKVAIPETLTSFGYFAFQNNTSLKYVFFKGDNPIRNSATNGVFQNCNDMHLFDMRHMLSAKDKASGGSTFTANNVYLYINVPDNLYSQFTALPNWSALNLKRWVHSCDVETFEEIENPIDGDYYSLKGDTNYLNLLGEKQIDIRQYVNGQWVEVDIG